MTSTMKNFWKMEISFFFKRLSKCWIPASAIASEPSTRFPKSSYSFQIELRHFLWAANLWKKGVLSSPHLNHNALLFCRASFSRKSRIALLRDSISINESLSATDEIPEICLSWNIFSSYSISTKSLMFWAFLFSDHLVAITLIHLRFSLNCAAGDKADRTSKRTQESFKASTKSIWSSQPNQYKLERTMGLRSLRRNL